MVVALGKRARQDRLVLQQMKDLAIGWKCVVQIMPNVTHGLISSSADGAARGCALEASIVPQTRRVAKQ